MKFEQSTPQSSIETRRSPEELAKEWYLQVEQSMYDSDSRFQKLLNQVRGTTKEGAHLNADLLDAVKTIVVRLSRLYREGLGMDEEEWRKMSKVALEGEKEND